MPVFQAIDTSGIEPMTNAYWEQYQKSQMEFFVKIVNGFQPITVFTKSFILDI